ncbi:MAG TPA: S-methyl-5'-thioadenosine phosphorylase [Sulfurihydrogenibium sp.]|uniref:S-methyl-5'-thioadenosine phosphorylase n=1 Tax=Sulfurihydrogenibium sp. (strain YO3AOP1) TaxID=436114 RepID=UPI0001724E0B|nr:S-methyl-5'-thioadenosine phosphorylase [Sulfurihydrogenibium sp. YO3AOP1]ACD66749.1 methylthioadenosine phosphorylase [Sulfurihydrogenibium sp. YO3AOP1]HBT98767.1 S-methyl-5'-thioadenosine phosphorylase [Sulfurihydrogenibium sp.]
MLGVIGGSGLYQIDGIEILDEIAIKTPFGEPSDKYIFTQYKGRKVVFLPRHGKGHKYPPHLINFRANIWGFRKLGVDKILSISAVGGINPNLNPGDFVISNQFIDFTKSRVQTFYEGIYSKNDDTEIKDEVSEFLNSKRVVHIDVTDPFCPEMRDVLIKVCDKNNFPFHQKGVYAATEGPRLETSAEIKFLRLIGADIVGMTLVPEIVLARELKMHFASISVVTNLAAGISQNRLTSDEVVEMMKEKNEQIKTVILTFIENLPERFNCECENVLKGAAI